MKCCHAPTDCFAAIFKDYAAFLSQITDHGLLEAYNFKPLIDGNALAKALDTKPGPWMKSGMDIIMAWQLRNPDLTDSEAAIEEVRASDIISKTPTYTKHDTTNGHVAKKQKKGELTSALVTHFLRETLKPLFSTQAQNPELTAAGRKRIGKTAARQNDFDFGPEQKKAWKAASNAWALDLLLWCCRSVSAKTLEREWGFLIPPLLAVLDATDTAVRAKGCNMLSSLLQNCPTALLKRTGLGPMFEESLYASVAYLPSLTPEAESVLLLDTALPALLQLAETSYPAPDGEEHSSPRQKCLDNILRKGFLQPYSHAGEHVRIAEVLLAHLSPLLNALGIDSVKHLKDHVPVLSSILSDPLGSGHPPLLLRAAFALQAIIANGWPRIAQWKGEILKGTSICWIRMEEEGGDIDGIMLRDIKSELKTVANMLASVLEADAESSTWENYVKKLIDTDARLEALLR